MALLKVFSEIIIALIVLIIVPFLVTWLMIELFDRVDTLFRKSCEVHE